LSSPLRLTVLALALLGLAACSGETPARPDLEVAVTFDDLPTNGPELPIERWQELMREQIAALEAVHAPAIGFVIERELERPGEDEARVGLLRAWLDAGLELGNHTFSHRSINDGSFEDYARDILRGERVTRRLLAERGRDLRYFRPPHLQTGATPARRDELAAFLREHGYRMAPATIENADWLFNEAYSLAALRGDHAHMQEIADEYVRHTEQMIAFSEAAAQRIFGRPIRHVIVLHLNLLNAEQFPRVAALFADRGYRFVTLDEALADAAYAAPDRYASPSGNSWLVHWDLSGPKAVDWTQYPRIPARIQRILEQERTTSAAATAAE
jgi:peptidoglycan/xylan/chitin deacetylase (PgdA/CDA1 family)